MQFCLGFSSSLSVGEVHKCIVINLVYLVDGVNFYLTIQNAHPQFVVGHFGLNIPYVKIFHLEAFTDVLPLKHVKVSTYSGHDILVDIWKRVGPVYHYGTIKQFVRSGSIDPSADRSLSVIHELHKGITAVWAAAME